MSAPHMLRKRDHTKSAPVMSLRATPKQPVAANPLVIMLLAVAYFVASVSVTVFLVLDQMLSILYLMFIPTGLAVSMYAWLCILAYPLRYKHDTVSQACASSNKNFLRVVLVSITCLLSVAMTAVLVDEYDSRGRKRIEDQYLLLEVISCMVLPLTGLFPTVALPDNFFGMNEWRHVNVGTRKHPVLIHGLFSWTMHFLGVIPYMFFLPIINCVYAHNRPESWVFLFAYSTVSILIFFIVVQGLIRYRKLGYLLSLDLDTLFVLSITSEAVLVALVTATTIIFSMKRNKRVPWDGRLDSAVRSMFYVEKEL